MAHTFSEIGVSPASLIERNGGFSFTITPSVFSEGVSEAFDGRIYLERSENGGQTWSATLKSDSGYEINGGKNALYRFRCRYSAVQEVEVSPALAGTCDVLITKDTEVIKEFKTKDGTVIATISSAGLDATAITEAGVEVATTADLA